MLLKTIHRSVMRELFIASVLALASLNLIIMTDRLISLTRRLGAVGASFTDILRLILYLQPQTALMTMPMALTIAVLFTYGRLNADNEITVMRACGMSFASISRPVFVLGTLFFLGGIALGFYIAPAGASRLRAEVADIIAKRSPFAIEEGIFNAAFRDIVIHVKKRPSGDTLEGVFIYDERKKDQPRTLYAETGRISGAGGYRISLDLRNGRLLIMKDMSMTDLRFGRYNLVLPIAVEKPKQKYAELTPLELLDRAEAEGERKERTEVMLEFWRRFTMPSACLLLMLLSPPLALKSGKTGRFGGLALALLVFTAFYLSIIYFENLSITGKLPHYAGAWGPHVLMLLPSLYMYKRASSR